MGNSVHEMDEEKWRIEVGEFVSFLRRVRHLCLIIIEQYQH